MMERRPILIMAHSERRDKEYYMPLVEAVKKKIPGHPIVMMDYNTGGTLIDVDLMREKAVQNKLSGTPLADVKFSVKVDYGFPYINLYDDEARLFAGLFTLMNEVGCARIEELHVKVFDVLHQKDITGLVINCGKNKLLGNDCSLNVLDSLPHGGILDGGSVLGCRLSGLLPVAFKRLLGVFR
jgi:hypothetical protein